jgi:SpoVK/Ycf46/Vps4 family AAA+-type ATPase
MLGFHLNGRPTCPELLIGAFAEAIDGQGYSASDLKLLVDESAKIAMQEGSEISYKHLEATAAQNVRPSITEELEMEYRLFAERAISG